MKLMDFENIHEYSKSQRFSYNLKTFVKFVCKGLESRTYKKNVDYVVEMEKHSSVRILINKNGVQTIQVWFVNNWFIVIKAIFHAHL